MNSEIIGVVLVFRDITEQERLENEAIKAQRLESIGTLAGGIAHDFNNLLTSILGNISLIQQTLQADEQTLQQLAAAEQDSLRARDLTRQLLTFSRGGAPVKQLTSMDILLHEATTLSMHGSNVRHELQITGDLMPTEVDPGQISQVIGNLLINADQAMPEGGVITLSADNTIVAADDPLPLPQGPYIRIRVCDNGTGISPEDLERIFDPYFTTKHEGNGLGLASCYSIIKNHRGLITVDSQPGAGSTFTIYLPASEKKAVPVSEPPPERKRRQARGQERILVMDDEEMIRTICTRMLESLGYETAATADGSGALELYQKAMQEKRPFAAVILDLTIPGGMGGRETARRMLARDPDVCLIVSSGYARDSAMAEYRKFGFKAMLSKPYQINEVADILRKVLAS